MNAERENFIVLLLGAADGPIPTIWHLQKEMFLLSRSVPKLQELFNFEKHYEGPYCQALQEQAIDPFFLANAYGFDTAGRFVLTAEGKKTFKELMKQYESNDKLMRMVKTMQLIRSIYDRLSKDELLLLIYVTYPEYVDLSSAYDRLVGDQDRRRTLAASLLKKGVLTEDRYNEIIHSKVQE